jgi:hypothetical protein
MTGQHASRTVCAGVLGLLWLSALWSSWECRGLFLDGSYYLLEVVRHEGFVPYDFFPSRAHTIWVTEAPAMLAIALGMDDTHTLARLQSFGLFALPLGFYSLALWRSRDDALLLAVVVAAIAMVFQTTSFFIVGEFNTANALALSTAVVLATGRNGVRDGAILAVSAGLAVRTYETLVYLGPLLAVLVLWRLRSPPRPSALAALLHGAAALLFLLAAAVALARLREPETVEYLGSVARQAALSWRNLSLDLLLAAAVTLAAWALLRPAELAGWRPYLVAGGFLALLALSPLLAVGRMIVGMPYAFPQVLARVAAGPLTALFCLLVWTVVRAPPAPLAKPQVARRLLLTAAVGFGATLPWNAMLTAVYASYLQEVRATIRTHGGPIAIEQTRLWRSPRLAQGDSWTLIGLSHVLRSSPNDGVIQPPRDYDGWVPPEPYASPPPSRFRWRD